VPIPYSTKYVYDSGKYSDESEIIRSGSDGICVNKYTSTYENGVFVGTVMSSASILSTPINELVSIGTIEGSRCDSKGYYIFPTDGTISSYFGYRVSTIGSANHKGVDIAASKGTAVLAADGGEVIFTGWVSGYGNLIKLRHDNGDVTYYGHLSKILVSDGASVAQGDKIAEVGSTGISTGPHLHFELRIDDTPVDPLDYLEF
jgi:murein DD-endopeptidase MepM/ murein hydrolase activator NlpD